MDQTKNNSKVLKWSLVIAIVIVLNLFYNYALSLVFSTPQYNDFCPTEQVNTTPTTQQTCIAVGGSWTQYPTPSPAGPSFNPTALGLKQINVAPTGSCNPTYTCEKKYENAQNSYDRDIFISLVTLGVITFAAALFFHGSEVLSIALSLGAVLDFLIASIRYWGYANSLVKVFVLAVALGALIWFSIKKFGNKIQG